MEKNQHNLKNTLARMAEYEPDEQIWKTVQEKLNELPLHAAVGKLPAYEPDGQLWELIERKSARGTPKSVWWYAAAASLAVLMGLVLLKNGTNQPVSYSQEAVDFRLQTDTHLVTDEQYQKLKAYCETETLVCNSQDYRRLRQEYEKLSSASEQLQQAIGDFNTEPELMRQFNSVEQQKAEILNEMAKMI